MKEEAADLGLIMDTETALAAALARSQATLCVHLPQELIDRKTLSGAAEVTGFRVHIRSKAVVEFARA